MVECELLPESETDFKEISCSIDSICRISLIEFTGVKGVYFVHGTRRIQIKNYLLPDINRQNSSINHVGLNEPSIMVVRIPY